MLMAFAACAAFAAFAAFLGLGVGSVVLVVTACYNVFS
jgi:hypothetical protein